MTLLLGALGTWNPAVSHALGGVKRKLQYTRTCTHAPLNRLSEIVATNAAGSEIARYKYTLGEAGQRLTLIENKTRNVAYAYDELYRLKSETITNDPFGINGSAAYHYDKVGNRLNRNSTIPGLLTSADTYDPGSDRLAINDWDANGNTISSDKGTDHYDFEDRLVRRNAPNGSRIDIVYDGDGNKVRETVDGVSVSYLVDELNPTGYSQVLEEKANNQLIRIYTYGHDLICQELRPLGQSQFIASYYGYDGSMSVRYLTNAAGAITDRYTFDAFGSLLHASGTTDNRYRFTGEEWSEALQMLYLRARYLDPKTGRFWNADSYRGTVTDPRSLHRYVYANNNAANCIDPSGNVPTLAGLMCEIALSFGASAFEEMESAARRGEELTPGQFMDRALITTVMSMASPLIQFNDFFETLGNGDEAAAYSQLIDSFIGMGLNTRMAEFQADSMMEERAMREELRDGIIAQTTSGSGDDWAGAACFVAGTPVLTKNGPKPIEQISQADEVASVDLETGERVWKKVTETFTRHSEGLIALQINGQEIRTTSEHPFRVKSGNLLPLRPTLYADFTDPLCRKGAWIPAADLRPGDVLETHRGDVAIEGVSRIAGLFTVYNLEVQDHHNYFVGNDGVLVHNMYLGGAWSARAGKSWRSLIFGKAQKTGTAGHRFRAYREAIGMAKSGNYKKVYLDRGYNKVSGAKIKANRRPDVAGVRHSGKIDALEVPSRTDLPSWLMKRNVDAMGKLPLGQRGWVDLAPIR